MPPPCARAQARDDALSRTRKMTACVGLLMIHTTHMIQTGPAVIAMHQLYRRLHGVSSSYPGGHAVDPQHIRGSFASLSSAWSAMRASGAPGWLVAGPSALRNVRRQQRCEHRLTASSSAPDEEIDHRSNVVDLCEMAVHDDERSNMLRPDMSCLRIDLFVESSPKPAKTSGILEQHAPPPAAKICMYLHSCVQSDSNSHKHL